MVAEDLDRAREAAGRLDWQGVCELLVPLADGLEAGAELELLGKAQQWTGAADQAVDAWERAVKAYQAAGDRRSAARCALMIRHVVANGRRDAALARGWMRRAEELLAGLPECPEQGHLARVKGRTAWLGGDVETGEALIEQSLAIGHRLQDAGLVAMTMMAKAHGLVHAGRMEEAFGLADEAAAMAASGELGPFATGLVFCNAISTYRDAFDFGRAGEWTESATRWCSRQSISGFPGICRVHRAEIMRLRGDWSGAAREAERAAHELEGNLPGFASEAFYELGEVRLRTGDRAGADEALRLAHGLGHSGHPARALLLAAEGDPGAGWRALASALGDPEVAVLDRARMLPPAVELALAAGDPEAAREAVAELERIAAVYPTEPMRAAATLARGRTELASGAPEAVATLRQALRLWLAADLPYEAAQARVLLARALAGGQDAAGSRAELEAAAAAFERLGAGPDAAGVRAALEVGGAVAPARRCLLFTDVVGSTRLVEAIGDAAWSDLSAWLDQLLRGAFAEHGGEEVDHAGDGFFVAFAEARAAAACGVAIQRSLAEHRRRHGFAPDVRIGIHATEAARSGRGYRGRGVHLAARIAAQAAAGEVLASLETAEAAGLAAGPPRRLRLKGIAEPVDVVALGPGPA